MSQSSSLPPNVPAGNEIARAAGYYAGAPPSTDDRNMAVLTYILCLFTGFIGPLIIWLMKKDQSAFVNNQGKEVLNWCITLVLGNIACLILTVIWIGLLLWPLLGLAHVIFNIRGAMSARKGSAYRYPFALRLLK